MASRSQASAPNPAFRCSPVALTIAGSDNSAGAGIQADLKTFTALGAYGLTAVTCVVAEVPGRVSAVMPVTPEVVREQIALLFDAFPVGAVKTGMLYSTELIETVATALAEAGVGRGAGVPLVVDPVMVATSGDPLLQPDAVEAYRLRLFPMATLLTPNLDEARVLLGRPISSRDAMEGAATELARSTGASVLLKGGHLGGPEASDLLVDRGEVHRFEGAFYAEVSTHGTGCTFSAAITAGLAAGLGLAEAVGRAKTFVGESIRTSCRWERPGGPTWALNHGKLGGGTGA